MATNTSHATAEDRAFEARVRQAPRNNPRNDADRLDFDDWERDQFPTMPDPLEAPMDVEQAITQQCWERVLGLT